MIFCQNLMKFEEHSPIDYKRNFTLYRVQLGAGGGSDEFTHTTVRLRLRQGFRAPDVFQTTVKIDIVH